MKDIQNVAILGAGAMGAYFASRFFDTAGFSTGLIAKGHRFDRLKNNGLVVNGKPYAIPVIHLCNPGHSSRQSDFTGGSHYRGFETSSP
jgi:2-dehydropantoate 2-reductase